MTEDTLTRFVMLAEGFLFIAGCLLAGFGVGEVQAIGLCLLAYGVGREDGRR